ncbi:hypothetical protein AX17_005003 [Amanita inopinata Kibby_2008]|nr:hypothetical protein AX17_005003 [Amanita inopinata Kibby_2008]
MTLVSGRYLVKTSEADPSIDDEEQDVSVDVEDIMQQIFDGLQDKDTIVRWSAAKGVARVAERLPRAFADQVLEMVMSLFGIHSVTAATMYDLPAVAESTWHGACLASAEMARRGLVARSKLPELLDWLSKALYFDLRKGSHSIGANVRDAAAYVMWALARTQTPDALEQHTERLARHLTIVALFDREVHVRRAASAAFQEFVGRTALFPAGIDVLRKTDFYAVSIRRNAFLEAAPQVAEHQEYRTSLVLHLLEVSIRHWDITIRILASQSLYRVIPTDMESLAHLAFAKAFHLLDSIDPHDLHGSLLALTEVAKAHEIQTSTSEQRDAHNDRTLMGLAHIPDKVVLSQRNDLITAASCRLIAQTLTSRQIPLDDKVPRWKKIVEFGLKHRNPDVQEAAAEAMARVSLLQDCSKDIKRLCQELILSTPIIQQSLGRLLGALRYDVQVHCVQDALDILLDCVTPVRKFNVEARRTCYEAMEKIILTMASCLKERVPANSIQSVFRALLTGLTDYTNDERGDVGSWIRIACIKALSSVSKALLMTITAEQDLNVYLPADLYKSAIAGILKQGVERLDNVREVAGTCFMALLNLTLPTRPEAGRWILPGHDFIQSLLFSETGFESWSNASWFFPKAVHLLEIGDYRKPVLAGIVMSMGCKTDSIRRPMTSGLVGYIQSLPLTTVSLNSFSVYAFVESLSEILKTNISNNNIVVPVLQTFNPLLEDNVLQRLSQSHLGLGSLRTLLNTVSRNVTRVKSIARVHESMKIVVNLVTVQPLFADCVPLLKPFLLHRVPRIRMDTAEYLYLVLQSVDYIKEADEVEAVILETEWMSNEQHVIEEGFKQLQGLLVE